MTTPVSNTPRTATTPSAMQTAMSTAMATNTGFEGIWTFNACRARSRTVPMRLA